MSETAYNQMISRNDAAALIPEDVASDVVRRVTEESAALNMFRRIPVSTNQTRMPVLSGLPQAYFVNGDTGMKKTTDVKWKNKFLNIEEIACIVPIPEAVLDDASFDVWEEIKPLLVEAVGRTFDGAVFFGIDKPASWPEAVAVAARAAGNFVNEAAAASAGGFLADIDNAIGLIEADGYDPTGIVAARTARGRFRSARSTFGDRLQGVSPDLKEYDGMPIQYGMRGLYPVPDTTTDPDTAGIRALIGDWDEFVVGVRQDVTYKILDQAVITDSSNNIILNLAQQDAVAMRVVFRAGYQVANIVNHDQKVEADRYPASVLQYS